MVFDFGKFGTNIILTEISLKYHISLDRYICYYVDQNTYKYVLVMIVLLLKVKTRRTHMVLSPVTYKAWYQKFGVIFWVMSYRVVNT